MLSYGRYAQYLKRTAGLTGQGAANVNGVDLDDTELNSLREFHDGRARAAADKEAVSNAAAKKASARGAPLKSLEVDVFSAFGSGAATAQTSCAAAAASPPAADDDDELSWTESGSSSPRYGSAHEAKKRRKRATASGGAAAPNFDFNAGLGGDDALAQALKISAEQSAAGRALEAERWEKIINRIAPAPAAAPRPAERSRMQPFTAAEVTSWIALDGVARSCAGVPEAAAKMSLTGGGLQTLTAGDLTDFGVQPFFARKFLRRVDGFCAGHG